ncbi:MAG: hypothetical protein GY711_11125 [bacterium]|nr:hypothetical protein [bacterium]
MSERTFLVEGKLYLSVEAVAEVYEVRAVWLREVCDRGLLGPAVRTRPTLSIAAVELDRVATIVRLHEVFGLDLEAIDLALE